MDDFRESMDMAVKEQHDRLATLFIEPPHTSRNILEGDLRGEVAQLWADERGGLRCVHVFSIQHDATSVRAVTYSWGTRPASALLGGPEGSVVGAVEDDGL